MNRAISIFSTLALVISTMNAMALRYMGTNAGMTANGSSTQQSTRSAACAPATGLRDLEWNNVRARIETGGSMWQDRANSRAAYEVPKDGGVSALYSGALWLGGLSPDQQLKLAAVTFRADGNDFWPGPLTVDGTAEVTAQTCVDYDRFFVSERQDALLQRQYFDALAAGVDPCTINLCDYAIPQYFYDYPAIGNVAAGQDYYLAPFYDAPNSVQEFYDPEGGDYPLYDLFRDIDCANRRRQDVVPLFGDQTFYWIFNDKGNVHSESQGQPIGMEIRAQAFAFTTNDPINNMTFLNYVMINRGTQTLTNTYFGSWVDSDLGNSNDDYVGCDVQRGLGYCYNGDAFDEPVSQSEGYGDNPPAVGVDFFEGPYQDEDLIDNPLTTDILQAESQGGIPYSGLGIGYGDGIEDNERFGMRRFVYYNIGTNPINGDPSTALHYYNYMRGIWKNGQTMKYGGNGVSGNGVLDIECDYMFPNESDPLGWGTGGAAQEPWTEQSSGNQAGDRRFIQAAGPFTLQPGDYNNITVGVVWARASSGDPYASIERLRRADDKAQALFDNCFELVTGPDAPDVAIQELENEVILVLSNSNPLTNNFNEGFIGFDPSIPTTTTAGDPLTQEQRSYKFEGYLVYQLATDEVSSSDLNDTEKARLIAQCDVKNGVSKIINYERDEDMDEIVPSLMVNGADKGIRRSFRITEDAFALANKTLVNHKTYYFMVIAYGYNNYEDYDVSTELGQATAYLASRKSSKGEIQVIKAIPHNVSPEAGGTVANSSYGDGVTLTRIEGKGNGLNDITISTASENEIVNPPYTTGSLTYVPGAGPVEVKVVDPLRIPAADFELRLTAEDFTDLEPETMAWELYNVTEDETYTAYQSFASASEDVLVQYGLSVNWGQYAYLNEDGINVRHFTDLISATIEYEDSGRPWLNGAPDNDEFSELNWIRSGTNQSEDNATELEQKYNDYQDGTGDFPFTDENEIYESLLGGTWSPACLASSSEQLADESWVNVTAPLAASLAGDLSPVSPPNISNILGLNNVDIVFTSDKRLWTRCPVLEMQPNEDLAYTAFSSQDDMPEGKCKMRRDKSVDKSGRNADDPGYVASEGDFISNRGMGWFPGYVIDVGTGERLNMAFGEDSWLTGENGRDMVWNPTSNLYSNLGLQPLFGGQHWIFVFKNMRNELNNDADYMPRYDDGAFMHSQLIDEGLGAQDFKKLFRACTWIGSALVDPLYPLNTAENGIVPNKARIRLRVAKAYAQYASNDADVEAGGGENDYLPLYSFSTKNIAATTNDVPTLESVLDIINVVPNPYYAFSSYETSKLDNRIKITNLPEECVVTVYDLNGTLIRQFDKADPMTSLDWDLKNAKNIPIASGTYIIHVNVPGVGEKVLKWFGVMRPIDLDNF
jgi:hypothetical protein